MTHYTAESHATWSYLIKRQKKLLTQYACPEFIEGLERICFDENCIPNINDVERSIGKYTDWHLVEVDDILTPENYFKLLSTRTLPVILTIRPFSQADFYTGEAPDVFHELFGHCPLLTIPGYADFLYVFAHLALKYSKSKLAYLSKLFWYAVEVGVIQSAGRLYAHGTAILSSASEIQRCFSQDVCIKPLDLAAELPAEYAGNKPQSVYFSVDSLSQLYAIPKLLDQQFERKFQDEALLI